MKNIKITLLYLIAASVLLSCSNSDNYKKDESGLEYIIFKTQDSNDEKVNINDIIILDLSYEHENGKSLFNSTEQNRRYLRKVTESKHSGGSFEDGLLMLNIGDSAVFRINAANFLMYSESYKRMPDNVKIDDNVIIRAKIKGKIIKDDFEDLLTEQYHSSEDGEIELLKTYISNANIKIEPTESGLYYIEKEKGKGKPANNGDIVGVFYSLTLIDGRLIETNLDKYPFNFKLGTGEVIKGWDEGISYMNEGGKAMFIIPSKLAYGEEGNEDILPYTSLIFNIELVSVK